MLGKPNLTTNDLLGRLPRPGYGLSMFGVYIDVLLAGAYLGSGTRSDGGLWQRMKDYFRMFVRGRKPNRTPPPPHEHAIAAGEKPNLRVLFLLENDVANKQYVVLMEGILMVYLNTMPTQNFVPHEHTPEKACQMYDFIREAVPGLPNIGGLNRAWPLYQGCTRIRQTGKCHHCGVVCPPGKPRYHLRPWNLMSRFACMPCYKLQRLLRGEAEQRRAELTDRRELKRSNPEATRYCRNKPCQQYSLALIGKLKTAEICKIKELGEYERCERCYHAIRRNGREWAPTPFDDHVLWLKKTDQDDTCKNPYCTLKARRYIGFLEDARCEPCYLWEKRNGGKLWVPTVYTQNKWEGPRACINCGATDTPIHGYCQLQRCLRCFACVRSLAT